MLGGSHGWKDMILPALRGYYTNLGANHIKVGCSRCKCERAIYHKENCKNRQYRFPAYCFSCGSMIVVEVRKVVGKEVVCVGKKAKPNYTKSDPKPPVKKPAPKKQPWT